MRYIDAKTIKISPHAGKYTVTKRQSKKHTQQSHSSMNTIGHGYPHNCEEAANKDKQSETLQPNIE
jgi:hypothetical protein